jgi:hypothetical protein
MMKKVIIGLVAAMAVIALAALVAGCDLFADEPEEDAQPGQPSEDGGDGKTPAPATEPEGNFTVVDTTIGVIITGYTGSATVLVIPGMIGGKLVTAIGRLAFEDKSLAGVTIPGSVITVGTYAFKDNQLESVTIPDSVADILFGAFQNNRLTSVTLGSNVATIGASAFADNQLASVAIPDSVTHIEERAFAGNKLTQVAIPDSVTLIEGEAFADNPLESVHLPSGVLFRGYPFPGNLGTVYAAANKAAGRYASGDGGVTWAKVPTPEDPDGYFEYATSSGMAIITKYNGTGNVAIPATLDGLPVAGIGYRAFYGKQLTQLDLPPGVRVIGKWAFSNNQLLQLDLPDGITVVDEGAFSTNKLVRLAIPSGLATVGGFAFSSNQLTELAIPDGVTAIGKSAFSNNKLASVTIGNGVTVIGEEAFKGNQLTGVTIGNKVESIETGAFADHQLDAVIIPDSVTSIGTNAFRSNSLLSVTIGANVAVSSYAFTCIMDGVIVSDFQTAYKQYGGQAGTYTRSGTNSTTWILQSGGSPPPSGIDSDPANFIVDSTGTILGYSGPGGQVIVPSSVNGVAVTAIGDSAFANKHQIAAVTIPEGVTSIGYSAFRFCTNLARVVIPESVTSIGGYVYNVSGSGYIVTITLEYGAFDDCYALESVTMPARLTGTFAGKFEGYTDLALTLTGTGAIPANAFAVLNRPSTGGDENMTECDGITGIVIEDGVTGIGQRAFSSCSGLETITFGASVDDCNSNAFTNCSGLKTITVVPANTVYSSVDGILYNKAQTELYLAPRNITGSASIPSGVTAIPSAAFAGRAGLTGVTIPSSVTAIGDSAFAGCAGLGGVTIPSSVTTIGERAFAGCTGLGGINVAAANSKYTSAEGVLFSKDKKLLIQYPAGHATANYTVPSGVEIIGEYAFEGCAKLTGITIPNSAPYFVENTILMGSEVFIDGVDTIKSHAFDGCTGLVSVTIEGSDIYDPLIYEVALMAKLMDPKSIIEDAIKEAITNAIKKLLGFEPNDPAPVYVRGFHDNAFPEGNSGGCGNSLKDAYLSGGAGTYTRAENGSAWTGPK